MAALLIVQCHVPAETFSNRKRLLSISLAKPTQKVEAMSKIYEHILTIHFV